MNRGIIDSCQNKVFKYLTNAVQACTPDLLPKTTLILYTLFNIHIISQYINIAIKIHKYLPNLQLTAYPIHIICP